MKRPSQYPLEAARSVREQKQRDMEIELAAAQKKAMTLQHAVATAVEERQQRMNALHNASRELERIMDTGCHGATIQRQTKRLADLRIKVEQQNQRIRELQARHKHAEKAYEQARKNHQKATVDHQVVRRHHARWQQEMRIKRSQHQENELEDNFQHGQNH